MFDFRERNIDWLPVICALTGLNLLPRYVPSLGINTTTFECKGGRSNQLRHLVRVSFIILFKLFIEKTFLPFNWYHYRKQTVLIYF